MIVCGLKLTHDGAVALLQDNRLVFSVEMEKIGNRRRYSPVTDLSQVVEVLADFGYRIGDVDEWVIDGWDGDKSHELHLLDHGAPVTVRVGPYRESPASPDLLCPSLSGTFSVMGRSLPYTSYPHAAGHMASVYCSSPFAARGEDAFVLLWDGGLFPRLYHVEAAGRVVNHGALFPLIGHAYAMAGTHFGPFRTPRPSVKADELSVAGKLMAYIAKGRVRASVLEVLADAFHSAFESDDPAAVAYRRTVGGFGSLFEPSRAPVDAFLDTVRARTDQLGIRHEDVLASVHQFLSDLLVERLTRAMTAVGAGPGNLCFGGGCALNIKWNSALRAHPAVREMWVPPFPNDSGSAIGGALLGTARSGGLRAMEWHTRSGPALGGSGESPAGWTGRPLDVPGLARILHDTGEPVVVLHGRAELGPRALGGRSIIAPATSAEMKQRLNEVKGREDYRPVAPICLVGAAPDIFDPGSPDPHMLFEHEVRPEWAPRIPAVVHLDGTARLQTVSADDDPTLAQLLAEYHRLSGIPVLCNTSANRNGSGFFPDVESAAQWGRVDRIWSDGVLYERAPTGRSSETCT